MAKRPAPPLPPSALERIWEQYRVTHMFPELAGVSTRNLLEQLVRVAGAHESRLTALEKRGRGRGRR
jgi:hypothetical protein